MCFLLAYLETVTKCVTARYRYGKSSILRFQSFVSIYRVRVGQSVLKVFLTVV